MKDQNNKMSTTTASPRKIKDIRKSTYQAYFISNPGPGVVLPRKNPLAHCLFVSHITCKHTLFFFFAQIIITSSIHNTFVHVKTFW